MKVNNEDTINITIFQNDIPSNLDIKGDIAIDTEAMGLQIYRDKLCLVQFCDATGAPYLVQFNNSDYSAPNLRALLMDQSRQKIFHFARFDVAIMRHYLNVEISNIFCTKIASKLARTYTDSHGLKDLVRELLGAQISKHQQSSDWGAQSLSKDQQEYAAKDVIYLHQLRDILIKMLDREKRLELALKLFAFIPTRVELDLHGWNEVDIFTH